MKYRKLLIVIIVVGTIIEFGLFFNSLISKSGDIPIESNQIKKVSCSNEKYSTKFYASSFEKQRTIQLTQESLLKLKNTIAENKGIIPSGEFYNLDCIEELNLKDYGISNISEIGKLKNLEVLDLSRNPGISDISSLSELTKLKALDLSENSYLKNISPLSKLYDLEKLYLNRTNINEVSSLSELVKLTELSISWTFVEDVTPLKNLVNLKLLYIRDLKILYENYKQLGHITPLVMIRN